MSTILQICRCCNEHNATRWRVMHQRVGLFGFWRRQPLAYARSRGEQQQGGVGAVMDVVGILLAAGKGERFDPSSQRLKLLESVGSNSGDAEPIVVAAARSLRAAVGPVIAIVRDEPGTNQDLLRTLLAEQGCTVVPCERAHEGIGASIACAVRAAPNARGWIIALADMPRVQQQTIAAVRKAIVEGAASAAPFYRGRRGHPVGFGAICGPQLTALKGDVGAREVLQRHPPVPIDVDDPGVLCDIDEPKDLANARAQVLRRIS